MNHTRHPFPLILIGAAILLSILAGCGAAPKTSDRDLQVIDLERVQTLREQGPVTILIDVRQPDRFAQSHIPGAINIPLSALRAQDQRLAEAKHLIVYASGWDDFLSPAAAKKLIALGYSGVYDFRGGLQVWDARHAPAGE